MRPSFKYENQHKGIICGIDEAGRGPLAGPVVAAAVVLKRDKIPVRILRQVNDSKQLTSEKRAYLFNKIHEFAHVSIAECSVEEIDCINILQASLLAMKKAFVGLDVKPHVALIDGNKAPPISDCKSETIIAGDAKSFSIAAASVIAKHYRDQIMVRHAAEFPHYGWETNVGYGTEQHLKAIEIHGITRLHRRSFAPVYKQLVKESSANN